MSTPLADARIVAVIQALGSQHDEVLDTYAAFGTLIDAVDAAVAFPDESPDTEADRWADAFLERNASRFEEFSAALDAGDQVRCAALATAFDLPDFPAEIGFLADEHATFDAELRSRLTDLGFSVEYFQPAPVLDELTIGFRSGQRTIDLVKRRGLVVGATFDGEREIPLVQGSFAAAAAQRIASEIAEVLSAAERELTR
ncbi:hypothetical protein [Gryllotalpicola protaetiae]|uniref:Uncharacterized protein n=1 Tax=Gryllotalpicola protaetiae TaxID=2419771 RepID=A0A387BQQ2_9MICO|nr:hypothetical protein [Gryllotalpicola protaetiae]AYG03419.1 hypothetical protein D7I44_07640 [Gryllotalpicola protaetiae]